MFHCPVQTRCLCLHDPFYSKAEDADAEGWMQHSRSTEGKDVAGLNNFKDLFQPK